MFIAVLIALALLPTTRAAGNEVQTFRFSSTLMGREMPYQVVLPSGYDDHNETLRYPVVYLLHGLSGHFDNWTTKTKLAEYAAQHNYLIVTPEGNDGWYTDSVTVPADRYESYIVKELIPLIDKKFRTLADREHRVIAGLSMGGYGALKFGLKYPEMFTLVGSFSGALNATSFNEKNAGSIGRSVMPIFGPDDSAARKANDIFAIAKGLSPDQIKKAPFIYQSCGTEDFLFSTNREFDLLLITQKIPHEYREHPGAHEWAFWDDQVREFLMLADRRLQRQKP